MEPMILNVYVSIRTRSMIDKLKFARNQTVKTVLVSRVHGLALVELNLVSIQQSSKHMKSVNLKAKLSTTW